MKSITLARSWSRTADGSHTHTRTNANMNTYEILRARSPRHYHSVALYPTSTWPSSDLTEHCLSALTRVSAWPRSTFYLSAAVPCESPTINTSTARDVYNARIIINITAVLTITCCRTANALLHTRPRSACAAKPHNRRRFNPPLPPPSPRPPRRMAHARRVRAVRIVHTRV